MSERVPKLTAKVYWDAGSLDMDLSEGLRGLEVLSTTTDSVEMIEESRLIRLEDTALPYIDKQNLYGRFRLDADLNFILTRRALLLDNELESVQTKESGHIITGYAVQNGRIGSRRYAFVDVQRNWHSDDILIHEAAHLLCLQRDNLADDPQHCGYEDCIMYPVDVDVSQNKFCGSCESQVISNAEKLQYAKYGKYALAPNAMFRPNAMG